MSKKQIIALLICNLVLWTVGNGMLPLLPVYAVQLGADSATAGYYLAFAYIAIAVGAISAGWVSDRLNLRKKPIILVGLVSIPLCWMMGRAGNIWILGLLTALLWACGGLALALVAILAGLSSGEDERGKIYGILALTSGLGVFIGGLASGFITDRWGYATMFSAMAILMFLMPLSGGFMQEKVVDQSHPEAGLTKEKVGLGRNYYLLFSSNLIASTAGFIVFLGRSLLMSDLEFGAFAISSTGAIGGLITLPIPLIMGWLSDRTGRKIYLYLGYLVGAASLFFLALAASLWDFYFVSILLALSTQVGMAIGNAFVTDLMPPESLGRGLSLFGATAWIGGVIGFAAGGYALQSLGKNLTIIIGIGLFLIAAVLLIPIRSRVRGMRG
jgi:MFS family permease